MAAGDLIRRVVVGMGMDPAAYTRGAQAVVQANQQIVRSGAEVAAAALRGDQAQQQRVRGLDRMVGQVDRAARAEQVLTQRVQQLARWQQEGRITAEQYAATVAKVTTAYDRQIAGIKQADTATRALGSAFQRAQGLLAAFGVTLGAFGLARFLRESLDAVRAMDRIESSLRVATGSAAGAADSLAFVRAEAMRLGLDLQSAAGAFGSLAAAARGTALEGQASRDIFTAVSEAMTALGRDSYATEGALRAIEQMISKGTVQAEELRGQLGERLPGAFQLAARAMGVTTQELNKLLQDGNVLAADLLPKLAAELTRTFGPEAERMSLSFAAQVNRLNTMFFEMKANVGDQLVPALTELMRVLNRPETIAVIVGLFEAMAFYIGVAVEALAGFVEAWTDGMVETVAKSVAGGIFTDMAEGLTNAAGGSAAGQLGQFLQDAAENARKLLDSTDKLAGDSGPVGKASKDFEKLAKSTGEATDDLLFQARIIKQGQRDRDYLTKARDLLLAAERDGLDINLEMLVAINAQAAAWADAKAALDKINESQEAQKKAQEDAVQAAEDYAKEVASVADSISDDLTEALFEGAENGFDSILDSMGLWLKRIALEIIKQKFVLPITTEIVGAFPSLFGLGGAGGAALSAGGNGFDLFGSIASAASDIGSWLGFGSSSGSVASGGGSFLDAQAAAVRGEIGSGGVGGGGFDWGGLLGAAGTGLGIGSLLFSLGVGKTGIGTTIGGGLGAAVGSFLGPVGTIAGGLLGGLLGGLFGNNKPSHKEQRSEFDFATGEFITSGQTGKKYSEENAQIAATLSQRLAEFAQGIEALTGASFSGQYGFAVVDRDTHNAIINGERTPISSGKSEEAFEALFDYVAKAAAGDASGISPELQAVIEKSLSIRKELDQTFADVALAMAIFDGSLGETEEEAGQAQQALDALNQTFDDAVKRAKELGLAESKVEEARQKAIAELRSGFLQSIEDQIQAIRDPQGFALTALDREFDMLRKDAEALGLDLVKIEELYGLRRVQVLEQIGQASVDSLQSFLDEIRYGSLSGASPADTLSGSRAAFEAAAAQALAGDAAAKGRIEELGRSYLDASRGYNASGAGYFEDRARVEEVLRGLLGNTPGFAGGTWSAPGGLALVGENGPEFMDVPRGAAIYPAAMSALIAGGAANDMAPLESIGRQQWMTLQDLLVEVRAMRASNEEMRQLMREQGAAQRRLASRQPAAA